MPAPPPFGLPPDLFDAAVMRLVDGPDDARDRVLAALQTAHPEHAAALADLARMLNGASRVLAETVAFTSPESVHFEGYRVLRQLGSGAFGVVYLCEQAEPIRRPVAIKLLRPGAGDRATLARFDAERRFLARLNHPAIAQIFDAGLLPDGRPWFVMEYVPGVPIAQYCDRAQLSIAARLRLFVRLCQGVQHAHDQGIVHRDLKPANILVVDVDGDAHPKIIDFGIARALTQPADGEARTETGRVVGTPGYMSPEQLASDLGAIDARSDLFSLGVVLYELLTGEMPWGRRPTNPDSEPPRPSARVATGTRGDGAAAATQRATQPKKLAAQLRGEIDWIVLKALSRERERRYATALEFAADVLRHLRGEAVLAGPPSWRHRLRKFARRHRVAVAASGVALAFTAGGAVLLRSYRDEVVARDRVASEAVDSLLARANDDALLDKPGAEPLRQALAQDALRLADGILHAQPLDTAGRARRASILWTLSQCDWLLGRCRGSEAHARDAIAESEAVVAAAPADAMHRLHLASCEYNLGRALASRLANAEARTHLQRAVDLLTSCRREGVAHARGTFTRVALELAGIMDPVTEAAPIEAMLRTAAEVQEILVAEHPEAEGERAVRAAIALERAWLALRCGDATTARSRFAPVELWLHDGEHAQLALVARAHAVAAQLAAEAGDLTRAYARWQQGIEVCRIWLANAPTSPMPLWRLTVMLGQRATVRRDDPSATGVVNDWLEVVELARTWERRFPDDPSATLQFVHAAANLAITALVSGKRRDLAPVEPYVRLAVAALDRLPRELPATLRCQMAMSARGQLGLVADALGLADADAMWEDAAPAMAAWRALACDAGAAEYAVDVVRVARHRLAARREADAAAMLEQLRDLMESPALGADVFDTAVPEAARLEAVLAVNRGDLAAGAAAAERALEPGANWRQLVAAADAMSTVWRGARAAGAADAAPWRDRAIELCEQAIARLQMQLPRGRDDPWLLVPLAQTQVLLALAQKDAGQMPAASLGKALDTLAAWRDEVHADVWNESLYRDGLAIAGR